MPPSAVENDERELPSGREFSLSLDLGYNEMQRTFSRG
jgi:hypothetical protein